MYRIPKGTRVYFGAGISIRDEEQSLLWCFELERMYKIARWPVGETEQLEIGHLSRIRGSFQKRPRNDADSVYLYRE